MQAAYQRKIERQPIPVAEPNSGPIPDFQLRVIGFDPNRATCVGQTQLSQDRIPGTGTVLRPNLSYPGTPVGAIERRPIPRLDNAFLTDGRPTAATIRPGHNGEKQTAEGKLLRPPTRTIQRIAGTDVDGRNGDASGKNHQVETMTSRMIIPPAKNLDLIQRYCQEVGWDVSRFLAYYQQLEQVRSQETHGFWNRLRNWKAQHELWDELTYWREILRQEVERKRTDDFIKSFPPGVHVLA